MTYFVRCTLFVLALGAMIVPAASAQTPDEEDPDLEVNVSQPDFTLAALPTNLRLPKGKFAFRVTHRFARPLGEGDFGSLLEDFFGFDSGALIGLELRYGLFRGRAGRHQPHLRSHDPVLRPVRRDEPAVVPDRHRGMGQHRWHQQLPRQLLARARRGSVARARASTAPSTRSRSGSTTPTPSRPKLVDDNSTLMLGLGTRLRLRPTVYVTAEVSPRLAGYAPGDALVSFGVEKRVGGHAFSINFSNGFGTTMAPMARGGTSYDDWYIGFNIARKFY